MLVEQSKLVKLLEAFGVHAQSWDTPKLAARINAEGGVARYPDPPDMRPDDAELDSLYDAILKEQAAGNLIEVVADIPIEPSGDAGPSDMVPEEPAEEPPVNESGNGKPKKRTAKKKPKPATAKKPEKEARVPVPAWSDGEKEYYAANPQPLPEEGCLAVTIRELKAAGKGAKPKPVTKEHILGVLKEEFPDRRVDAMETNLNNNLPSRLRWKYNVHVWKQKMESGRIGYYIVGDGKKPQPAEAGKSEEKPAKKPAAKKKAAKKPAKKPAAKKKAAVG